MGFSLKLNLASINQASIARDGTQFDLSKIRNTANGGDLFHGTTASALLSFTAANPEVRGHLLPMRRLLEEGLAPFSGERGNSLDPKAPNAISTVAPENFASAYDYANSKGNGNVSEWNAKQAAAELSALRTQLGGLDSEHQVSKANLLTGQLERYGRLSEPEKALVDGSFPVVYALKAPPERVRHAGSDIVGEHLIAGGVQPEEIRALYVPRAHVDQVAELIRNAGAEHIKVAALEDVHAQ